MIGKSKGVQPVPNKNVAIWKFHLGFWRVRNHTERRFFSNFPMFVAGFLHLLQTVEHFEFWNNSGIEFIDIIILLHFLGNLFEGYFPQMCSFRHHIAQNYFPSSLFRFNLWLRIIPDVSSSKCSSFWSPVFIISSCQNDCIHHYCAHTSANHEKNAFFLILRFPTKLGKLLRVTLWQGRQSKGQPTQSKVNKAAPTFQMVQLRIHLLRKVNYFEVNVCWSALARLILFQVHLA